MVLHKHIALVSFLSSIPPIFLLCLFRFIIFLLNHDFDILDETLLCTRSFSHGSLYCWILLHIDFFVEIVVLKVVFRSIGVWVVAVLKRLFILYFEFLRALIIRRFLLQLLHNLSSNWFRCLIYLLFRLTLYKNAHWLLICPIELFLIKKRTPVVNICLISLIKGGVVRF